MKKVEPSTETGCGSETSTVSSSAWWFKLKWKDPGLIFISALEPFCFFSLPSCLLSLLSSCWILHACTHRHWKHRDLQGSWRGSGHRVAVNVTVVFYLKKLWSLSLKGFADRLDQPELRAACARLCSCFSHKQETVLRTCAQQVSHLQEGKYLWDHWCLCCWWKWTISHHMISLEPGNKSVKDAANKMSNVCCTFSLVVLLPLTWRVCLGWHGWPKGTSSLPHLFDLLC